MQRADNNNSRCSTSNEFNKPIRIRILESNSLSLNQYPTLSKNTLDYNKTVRHTTRYIPYKLFISNRIID